METKEAKTELKDAVLKNVSGGKGVTLCSACSARPVYNWNLFFPDWAQDMSSAERNGLCFSCAEIKYRQTHPTEVN